MDVSVYIKGQKLDLFQDENIEMNLNAKNISDISKIFADFTQGFTVPASPNNNKIFEYWYDATVDGTYNANLRVDSLIEINTLPYKYGSIQMDGAKLKDGLPYSYSITFFGNAVNLSDLFGELELKDLDLSAYNHDYNSTVVSDAMHKDTIANGDVYYPLINSVQEMSIDNGGLTDLTNASNGISYRDFKPAIRLIRLIEAIETKFNVAFTRDFLGRAVFYNAFMWLSRESGQMKAFGERLVVNLNNQSGEGFTFNGANDTITYLGSENRISRSIRLIVKPETAYLTVPYKISIYNNGDLFSEVEGLGRTEAIIESIGNNLVQFKIQSTSEFQFFTTIVARKRQTFLLAPTEVSSEVQDTINQSISSRVIVSDQVPNIKIKDFFGSLINQFNLIIKPENGNLFYIDTLDNWYLKGDTFDITKLVDIKDIGVKRPDVKKQIDFKYQKAGTILAGQYEINNSIGYGDLKAKFDISGSDLKIESQFENMLFERLPNEVTGDLTDIQAGFSIDKELKPYNGKPIIFYKNGWAYSDVNLYLQPSITLTKVFHTATEDNIKFAQVTSSLNFGADNSSFFQVPIDKSLYQNWWYNYIADLYNRKTRVLTLKCVLPVTILYKLTLNDLFIIGDMKYKISTAKVDLTTGKSDIEIFTDYSIPSDSIANLIPITVDNTFITVDSTAITVDSVYKYDPAYSFVTNSISIDLYDSTNAMEIFEVKINANATWTATPQDSWLSVNNVNGNKTGYIRVTVSENAGTFRTGTIKIVINTEEFILTVTQE